MVKEVIINLPDSVVIKQSCLYLEMSIPTLYMTVPSKIIFALLFYTRISAVFSCKDKRRCINKLITSENENCGLWGERRIIQIPLKEDNWMIRVKMKNNVRKLRTEVNMTQVELAKLVNVSSRTIISIENEKYNPSLILAYRIAEIFKVSMEDLYCLKENKALEDQQNE